MTAHEPENTRNAPDPLDPLDRLKHEHGRQFWRSLDELAETDDFQRWVAHEFPNGLPDQSDDHGLTRRQWLKLMGASFTLAALPACSDEPREQIVPYVQAPAPNVEPGNPLLFATAMSRGYETLGVLAESHMGRPTKIEGNPRHPASRGATDLFAQGEVLTLCDPDRSQTVRAAGGRIATWDEFNRALRARLQTSDGEGVRVLTGAVTSPSQLAQIEQLHARYPGFHWHSHEPIDRADSRAGASLAFGRPVDAVYEFSQATRIVSFDADFLFAMPGAVAYARDFADQRRVRKEKDASAREARMNRLYVAEPTPSITGAKADERLPLQSRKLPALAAAVASALGIAVSDNNAANALNEHERQWARICAQDLRDAGDSALALAGESQPPQVHALAYAINAQLGSIGRTVRFIEPVDRTDQGQSAGSLSALVEAMQRGEVNTLIILDANPVYNAPANLAFADALDHVPFTAHMGLYRDETAHQCRWHLPMNHVLEAWGDVRAYDGTASIIQPLIEPLYSGRTPQVVLDQMLDQPLRSTRDLVREHWRNQYEGADFETWWHEVLRVGVVPGSASPTINVSLDAPAIRNLTLPSQRAPADNHVTLNFKPSPTLWDGRYANNGWLQEIPAPMTKLTWGNAVLVSPNTAKALGLSQRGGATLTTDTGRTLTAPVWILPGQTDDEVTLPLGYGRTRAGSVGNRVGVNAYRLRTSAQQWAVPNVRITPAAAPTELATTQNHHTLEDRHMYRVGDLQTFRADPEALTQTHAEPGEHEPMHLSLYPESPGAPAQPNAEQQWGMSIDLTSCIGCNACTIACQAENAIPIVGKTEVQRGREMHWIRVDRYFEGPPEWPAIHHQPVPCMHCENAPCEVVCPVEATLHSEDGLNEMIYNRCIGTRYCSNNCPYKVRRFNFLQYSEEYKNSLALQKNPDVTVRARGVMEKCTYCVQRIRRAQIDANNAGRTTVADGEIETACQQVCPTQAIAFGDIADPATKVSREKSQPHDYAMLKELNTKPRTTYLAEVRNPNPRLSSRRL